MKISPALTSILLLTALSFPACNRPTAVPWEESHIMLATSPQVKDVTLTHRFVCQIHSRRHIEVRALERGYLEAIQVKEGQQVKEGEVLFKVMPILYQKKADAGSAEAKLVQLDYNYTKRLYEKKVVSENELLLREAKLAKAQAEAQLVVAELNFATIKAPFDGIIDRLSHQQGSLVEEGEVLTSLSDNSVMWVYFNVPEARYLDFMSNRHRNLNVELMLANGRMFDQPGKLAAIEADFNNETGTIPFRADFPNPNRLLRNGETGTILISRVEKDALIIPQRATFQILENQYVYVVDKDKVAHQREIVVLHELEDIYVIKKGLEPTDKIILEGMRRVHDGEKVDYEYRAPIQVNAHLKYHAE